MKAGIKVGLDQEMAGIGSGDTTHEDYFAFNSPQTVGQTAVGTAAERVIVVCPG